jgi:sigma-B regulation protein RsbU (phosphoserine phosphatase)
MNAPRLEVRDAAGRRLVPIDKSVFGIGRRVGNDLCLTGTDISRDHAEIARDADRYVLRDRGSRFGTFVNGNQVTEHPLKHADVIRLGRSGGVEMVFLVDEAPSGVVKPTTTHIGDLRQLSSLLEGLRALGSGRVLDEVLALVIDSALDVSGAERGFIMLENSQLPATEDGKAALEFKLGRAKGGVTLPGKSFETSRQIPQEVFASGRPKVVADLLDGDLANIHMGTIALGIRHVLCSPLKLVRVLDEAEAGKVEQKNIGVLYLDSRERGSILSPTASSAVETLSTEAALAIENARLYRQAIEKARLEEEMKIAAQIQQMLVPRGRRAGTFYDAIGSTLPCRSIGGDFFDYIDLPSGGFGFAVADVAGKGAPAALLTAILQGGFSAQASFGISPSETLLRLNQALFRRGVESRYATMFYAIVEPDGRLAYSNGGHNQPFLLQGDEVRRLAKGGLPVGLFELAQYDEETIPLHSGDLLVLFSDGVSEALSAAGEEFGEDRIVDCLLAHRAEEPPRILDALLAGVKQFTAGAVQSDDVTALVVRYTGK